MSTVSSSNIAPSLVISRLGAAVVEAFQSWLISLFGKGSASPNQGRAVAAGARALLALGVPTWIIYKVFVQPFLLSPLRKIPGPPSNPLTLLGNIPELAREEAGAPFLRWANRHGGIVLFRALFNTPVLLVTDPAALRRIYGSQDLYRRSKFSQNLVKELVGESLISSVGAVHKRQRAMLNPSFRVKELAEMTPTFALTGLELATSWRSKVEVAEASKKENGVVLNIFEEVSKCTLDIIGRAAFGYEFRAVQDHKSELHLAFQEIMSFNAFVGFSALRSLFPILKLLPTAARRRYLTARKVLAEKCDEIYEARVKSSQKGGCKDLLSTLIRANQDATEKMSRNELRDQILTFVLAGHETTSTTLTWALLHLAEHPDVQARLHAEITAALPKLDPLLLSYDLANSLQYTDAVVKETLRFIPTVPFLYRSNMADDELLGFKVPKGTTIITPPIVMHRLKSLWGEDADCFNPDRWLTADAAAGSPEKVCPVANAAETGAVDSDKPAKSEARAFGAFMPFSLGPRNCIGARFATTELKILLTVLIHQFSFATVPGIPPSHELLATMKPLVHLRVTPRR
ncbi:cytochrome P450 [Zopfochytrium polystomum]|nr:cytochrome P450 [Zopfochytrium polystomum]